MNRYISYAFFIVLIVSIGLLAKAVERMELKARTALKRNVERYFLAFEQKTQKLDVLGQKNYLGQLTIQGSKWPILVQYTEDHWKILQPVQRVGLDNNYFSKKIFKITSALWSREESPVRTTYYRILPQKGGGHRVLEIHDFETLFLAPFENLQLCFTKKETLDSSIPFFNIQDPQLKKGGTYTWKGYQVETKRTLEGINEPLLLQMVHPYSFEIWMCLLATAFSTLLVCINLFKIAKKGGKVHWWVGYCLSSVALVLVAALYNQKKSEIWTLEKKLFHYDSAAFSGAQEYIYHIQQLAKSLQSIYHDDILKADASILKKWPYIERIQWIDHKKNLLKEIGPPQPKHSPSLRTLFMKDTGWILTNKESESPLFIHYLTENEVSIYLQMDFKPLSLGFLSLREKALTEYSLSTLSAKNEPNHTEQIGDSPFILKKERDSQPHLYFFFLAIPFFTLGWAYFLLRIYHLAIIKKTHLPQNSKVSHS
ncbi:MAG: hypothetical protein ACOYL1_06350 [Chlamydiia bacterium]